MNIKRFFSTGNDKRREQALQILRDEKRNNITNNGKEMIIEFDYKSHNITLEMSFFSGKEAVYVDDKKVSEQRNLFKFKGIHQLTIDNTPHELHMGFDSVADWLKSEACFTLHQDSECVHAIRANCLPTSTKAFSKYIVPFFIGGVVVGGFIGYAAMRGFLNLVN